MTKRVKLSALLVANQLDIKGIKSFLDIKPLVDLHQNYFTPLVQKNSNTSSTMA